MPLNVVEFSETSKYIFRSTKNIFIKNIKTKNIFRNRNLFLPIFTKIANMMHLTTEKN